MKYFFLACVTLRLHLGKKILTSPKSISSSVFSYLSLLHAPSSSHRTLNSWGVNGDLISYPYSIVQL